MATAVLDIDLMRIPSELQVAERYDKAFILIRYNDIPVGKVWLPVASLRVSADRLRELLIEASGQALWDRWLRDYLDWDEAQSSNTPFPKATVAVCTRDRAEDLQRCLTALMGLPDDGQELLVVDNCPSTDAAERITASCPRCRYVREDRPGSSAARNRALLEARHDIVAFTDDDAAPDRGWLRALLRNFGDSRVLCVTGQVMPLELETEAQEWFERYSPLGRGFKRIVYDGAHWSRFRVAPIGAGASMALHRSLLDSVGGFDPALGVGTPARCGEDHDLFSRILAGGFQIVYEPAALSRHRHRRAWDELLHTLHGYGVGVYAFWTRSLVVDRELGAAQLPLLWLLHDQLPSLIRSLLKLPGSVPLDLLKAELRGCLSGPRAYFLSRKLNVTKRELQ